MKEQNPICFTDIYHCDKCDWKGKSHEALHEEADDTYDLKCPRCQWEFVELLSPEKLLRMQCRNNFLQIAINMSLIQDLMMRQDCRAQIGSYDSTDLSVYGWVDKNENN